MFGAGFESILSELLKCVGVILLMGGVVKLIDDFLDLRYDTYVGTPSLAVRLGEGTLPYAMIGFTIAVMIDAPLAASIMIGAYTVGMVGDLSRRLPSGLAGYQESVIILLLALIFLPWQHILWAVTVMLAIQIVDDIVDFEADRRSGNPNFVRSFGFVESILMGLIALVIASITNAPATAIAFAGVPVILWIYHHASNPSTSTRGRGWMRW